MVVITSKENLKIPNGIRARVEIHSDVLVWHFSSEDKALNAAVAFSKAGFEYVQYINERS